ncbi:MAG TPA: MBL fold metallo-hydrolase [Mycobacteriales bacterium]|nr:MBL fold metallo-hydrolase [Mycobacteriales bacterium]
MQIESLANPCLGNRTYVITEGSTALVVDPPRDIDRIEAVAERHDARIELVAETHRHADYVSGGLELSRRHRATYVVPPGDPDPRFGFTPATEGVTYAAGGLALRALATPGHTPHHVALVIEAANGPVAVCTGGALLNGSVGRTDLYGSAQTVELAHAQWRSVRRLVDELPPDTLLLPTHGFGSFCSADVAGETASATLAEECLVNPALLTPEQDFVDALIAGYGPIPRHYGRLPLHNAIGPTPVVLDPPKPLEPKDLIALAAAGHWLVDVRDRVAFAGQHLAGSINIEASGPLVAYLPWILPAGAGVVLLGSDSEVATAQRQLVQVGIDRPLGMMLGSPDQWSGGDRERLRSYSVRRFADLAEERQRAEPIVLDVRSEQEYQAGHVVGARHFALPDLAEIVDSDRRSGVPPSARGIWVYCGGGFRAAVAASLLNAREAGVVLVNQPFDTAVRLGITTLT